MQSTQHNIDLAGIKQMIKEIEEVDNI